MSILNEIIDVKKDEVKKLRKKYSLSSFSDSEYYEKEKLSLFNELNSDENIGIIAEVKKASPSKGILREDFNHIAIAETYMEYGVKALSVLTDVNFFQGNITYLSDIAAFKTKPLLRKDFIIDEYQVFEAKHFGADAVLLIGEALSKQQVNELTHAAYETDLDVLLELHSDEEFGKIDFNLNKLIGVNNRDLKTFRVDVKSTVSIAAKLPNEITLVSESGIDSRETIDTLKNSRVDAVLVGEYFMKSENIKDSLKEMAEWCIREN